MSYTGLNLSNDDYNALNDNVYRFVGEMNDDNRSNMDRRDAAISAVQLLNFMAEVAYTSGDRGLAATIVRQRDAHIDLYPQFYGVVDLTNDGDDGDGSQRAGGQRGGGSGRPMNTAPLNVRQLIDKDVARKFSMLQTVYGNLETMTTAPTDGSAPAFIGIGNIPEQHTFLVTVSECLPNHSAVVSEKRRRYPVISVRTTDNKHLRSGQIAGIFEAVWRRFAINGSEFLTDPKKLERAVKVIGGNIEYEVLGTTDPNKNYRTHFNDPSPNAADLAVDLGGPRTNVVQMIINTIGQSGAGLVTPPSLRGGGGGTGRLGRSRSGGWSLPTTFPGGRPILPAWASPQSRDGGSADGGAGGAARMPNGPSGRPKCMFGPTCPRRNSGCTRDHN